jgi:glycosyltransferase involved in cell wall biosynthesis
MKKPLLSIVVPAYNEEGYLGYCLQSLLEQDFPKQDFEIIVVNNASTDKTETIARAFKVKVISEPKKGTVFARQKGTLAAQGKIIISFDADSEAEKDYLKRLMSNFKRAPWAIAVAGFYRCPDLKITSKIYLEFFSRGLIFLYTKVFGTPFYISATNLAFTKEAFLKCGGYPLEGGRPADQRLFLRRLKKVGKVIFDPNLIVTTSPRRIKNRFITSLVYDNLTYTYLDPLFYEITKRRLPGGAPDIR